jgi:hypothetical protein
MWSLTIKVAFIVALSLTGSLARVEQQVCSDGQLSKCSSCARRRQFSHTSFPAQIDLASNEASPEELFGILGITKDVCDGILAFLFVRCTEGSGGGGGGGGGQMGMGMGKRGRRTKESVVKRELTDTYNRLSTEDKKRVLVAVKKEDRTELAKIFSR